jgi:hypothetical protein
MFGNFFNFNIIVGDLGTDSRLVVLESRISRLEKEKTEEQTEKERLMREVEVQNQRISILQRQLDKQQVCLTISFKVLLFNS